jgi:AraC-like DNA-binding protein
LTSCANLLTRHAIIVPRIGNGISLAEDAGPEMETFLATLGQVVVRLIEMHGVDARALLREAGVDPSILLDANGRISSRALDATVAGAAAQIPDPAFGLRAARCWHPSNLGVLGHAWLASSTLRTGLQRLERYGRILGEKGQLRITDTRDGIRVAYDHRRRDPLLRAIGTDLALSLVVDMCRANYGASLRPVEVQLSRSVPADPGPYRSFYGCPVRFGAPEDFFLLSARAASEPLSSANRGLVGLFEDMLAAELAARDKDDVAAQCKSSLIEQLTSGELSETAMAKQLNMSRRTLQRKLAESHTTYQKLVDDTRRELALRHMEDPRKSITDVTFLLGFSGQSAFTRAFRRWTGMSPTLFREQKRTASA